MKTTLLRNWNIARWLRLLIGAGALIQGIWQRENIMLIAGGILVLMALLNTGCCGSNSCPVPVKDRPGKAKEDEELTN